MKIKNGLKKTVENFKNRQGLSTLLLTLFITFLLSMFAFVLLLISVLSAKRANQVRYSQTSFSAAEGALHETIQHLRNDSDWPDSLPDVTEYTIGEAEIKRTITKLEDGTLRIDISADSKGVKRRLIATFARGGGGEKTPLDIVLVIDRSGSMKWPVGGDEPAISFAKNAAISFVDIIELANQGLEDDRDKIGLVSFGTDASMDQPLTEDYDDVRDAIEALPDASDLHDWDNTNIAGAIRETVEELQDRGRKKATKVIILLSDGVAYIEIENCVDCACLASDYDPPHLSDERPEDEGIYEGDYCSEAAISQADTAKSLGYILFSLQLNNFNYSACDNIPSTRKLGRLTLLRISNELSTQPLPDPGGDYTFYKETDDASELDDIYREVAETITSPEFFEYQEGLPEPD